MEEINLKEFLGYLKRYIVWFIIAIIIAVGAAVGYDLGIKKPVYQARTTIVIAKNDAGESAANTLNDVNASQKLTSTYSEIAKSELVLNRVIENLGLSQNVKELSRDVTVKPVENTSILSVQVKNLEPEQAAIIANEIARVFSEEVMKIYKLDNVSQLSVAEAPEAPANNTLVRDIVLAVAVAVVAVAGVAFLRFYLDDTVKYNEDAEKTYGLPVTGRICKSEAKTREGADELIAEKSPKAIVSENIKSLRTNLQFTAVDKNLKTILVTSTNSGEGKSFVSSNLAVSFAQADKRVLIVDCDLRKGRIHKLFRVPNVDGLSNLLADDLVRMDKYIRPTQIENLHVITCGTYPPNPSELLASQKNKRLIAGLKNYYDIIIFDGAPVGGLADSVILSSLMDETLIVTREGATSKSELKATKEALDKVGAKIAGLVFNMVSQKSAKYYSYYYGESEK